MKRRPSEGVGSRLRAARLAAGFKTAGDAADALGISPPTYYAHENGNRKVSGDRVVAYAQTFRVSVEWLLLGKGGPPAREVSGTAATSPASASAKAARTPGPPGPTNLAPSRAPPTRPVPGSNPKVHVRAIRRPRRRTAQPSTPSHQDPHPPPPTPPERVVIPISGEARRGAYFEDNRRPTGLGTVEAELPPGRPSAGLSAIRMADASMDRLVPEGGVAIWRRVNWGTRPENAPVGEIVVVETTYAGLVEQTVAQIQPEGGKVQLSYLSSDYSLRGSCDFEPERPPRGQPLNPFLQYRRKILGVVLTDVRVVPPPERPHTLQFPDAD